jgi:hypothetical protein
MIKAFKDNEAEKIFSTSISKITPSKYSINSV